MPFVFKAAGPGNPNDIPLTPEERRLVRLLTDAINAVRNDAANSQQLRQAIAELNRQQALGAVRLDVFITEMATVGPVIRDALRRAGLAEWSGLNLSTRVGLKFDVTDPRATAWAERHAGRLISYVNETNRTTIQQVIINAFQNQVTVDDTARLIRHSIGLTDRQAVRLQTFRTSLRERLVAQNVPSARIDELVEKQSLNLSNRMLKQRAMSISRTEIMTASNQGRYLSWAQAVENELVDPNATKEWITAPEGSRYGAPCPICAPMNGQQVPWRAEFDNGVEMPPAHPSCRCTAVLVPNGVPSRPLADVKPATVSPINEHAAIV